MRQFRITECWELDALNPAVIAGLIRDEVRAMVNLDAWNSALADEHRSRSLLEKASANWSKVEDFLDTLEAA